MKKAINWENTWGTIEFYRTEDDLLDKIQQLLDNGADINARDRNGDTPLILAVCNDNIKCVDLLLKKNPNIDIRGRNGNTALNWATYRGSEKIVEMLLQNQAQTNLADEFGFTPLHWAVNHSKINIVRMLVEAGVEYNDLQKALDCIEQTKNCSISEDIAEILQCGLDGYYDKKNKVNDFDDMFWGTGLRTTDVQDDTEISEDVVAEEPVVEETIPVVKEVKKVVEEPVAEQVPPVVEKPVVKEPVVKEKAKPVVKTVIMEESMPTVKKQAKKGFFSRFEKTWFFSWRKVKWADSSEKDVYQKVQRLLNAGANINAQNRYGETPLMYATEYNCMEVAKLLILNGADPNMCDGDTFTALHKAAQCDLPNMAKILVVNGANVNTLDKYGRTALHWAAEEGYLWVIRALADAKNAELNIADRDGNTPLMLAVREGYADIVGTLIKYGADANIKDTDGKTVSNYLNPAIQEDRDMLRVIRDARKDREQFLRFEKERKEKEQLAILSNIINAEDEKQVFDLLDNDRGAIRAQIAALQALLRQTTPKRAEKMEKLRYIYDHADRRREYARMKQLDRALARSRELSR